ncbi:hypothetical protein GME_16442 [Halomonas sp. TD01]|nr:hypothetical protein GME_16442 [Halomonas sp. TD01]
MHHLADTQSATYTPLNGTPITVSVILDRDVERTVAGMQGVVMETRTELTGYTSELGEGARGDVVTVNGTGWRLGQKASDDGYLVTWVVTQERI